MMMNQIRGVSSAPASAYWNNEKDDIRASFKGVTIVLPLQNSKSGLLWKT
jgi:hypothetical protein